jgi:hypothetical protein
MRLRSRIASSISHAHTSERADDGDSTKTTVSALRIRLPRRLFQSSPPEMPWRSSVVSKPVTSSAAFNWSAKLRSSRL